MKHDLIEKSTAFLPALSAIYSRTLYPPHLYVLMHFW